MQNIIRTMKRILKKYYRKITKAKKNSQKRELSAKAAAWEETVSAVMKKTGWTKEEAKTKIKEAKRNLGVSAKNYLKYEFYSLSADEQKRKYEKILKDKPAISEEKIAKLKATNKSMKKLDSVIADVANATGWTKEYAEAKFWEVYSRLKCTPAEYLRYKIYKYDYEKQATFYYVTYQKILHRKYGTDPKFVKLIRDKERTNNLFSEYVRRPWCVNDKVSFKQFCRVFKDSSRIIYKPIDGHCGYGVQDFHLNGSNMREVYDKLINCPQGVVEEYIVQHPDMRRLNPSSVNSLRFVTISWVDESSGELVADVVYSIVRIGREGSIVDNLHSGGMVANVDLETGTLVTNAADHTATMYSVHPETGTPIKGFKIPYFVEAREMVEEALKKKQVKGYLGWDIAIGENGPLLLEINNRPGADGLQTAYAQEGKGMLHIMAKYL